MLALLGWNSGTEQELFSMDELIQSFSIERIHKGGAKFDFEKAKWFNHQYLLKQSAATLAEMIKPYIPNSTSFSNDYLARVADLIKERCHLLSDFWSQGYFFFETPEVTELQTIREKWNDAKQTFFTNWLKDLAALPAWEQDRIEASFNEQVTATGLKKGDVMLPFRIMLVGGKFGPGVFDIAVLIGKEETHKRIQQVLEQL